jgi:hypothetical protein
MGSLGTSLADDYKLDDNAETITYTSKLASGNTTLTIHFASWSTLSQKEINGSQGFYQMGDRSWLLGAAEFTGGITPKPGDSFVDASSITWEVLDADLDEYGIAWDVTTRKAR